MVGWLAWAVWTTWWVFLSSETSEGRGHDSFIKPAAGLPNIVGLVAYTAHIHYAHRRLSEPINLSEAVLNWDFLHISSLIVLKLFSIISVFINFFRFTSQKIVISKVVWWMKANSTPTILVGCQLICKAHWRGKLIEQCDPGTFSRCHPNLWVFFPWLCDILSSHFVTGLRVVSNPGLSNQRLNDPTKRPLLYPQAVRLAKKAGMGGGGVKKKIEYSCQHIDTRVNAYS